MPWAEPGDVTVLLARAREGDAGAATRLLPLVYDQLRALAASYMRRERPDHTLQPTALVHEAFLKLVGVGGAAAARDRTHFLALAARAMRQILVDHVRARRCEKRGGGLDRVTLEDTLGVTGSDGSRLDLLDLDRALDRLAELDERQSRMVELRFFAGLDGAEVAAALGLSERTVRADWRMARAWLKRELRGGG